MHSQHGRPNVEVLVVLDPARVDVTPDDAFYRLRLSRLWWVMHIFGVLTGLWVLWVPAMRQDWDGARAQYQALDRAASE